MTTFTSRLSLRAGSSVIVLVFALIVGSGCTTNSSTAGSAVTPPQKPEVPAETSQKLRELMNSDVWFASTDEDFTKDQRLFTSKGFKAACMPSDIASAVSDKVDQLGQQHTLPNDISTMRMNFTIRFVSCADIMNYVCEGMEMIGEKLVYTYPTVSKKERSVTRSDIQKDIKSWRSLGQSEGEILQHSKILDRFDLCGVAMTRYRLRPKS